MFGAKTTGFDTSSAKASARARAAHKESGLFELNWFRNQFTACSLK